MRILGKGTTPRRKVGRAVARVLRNEIREASGPQQFAMHADGAGHVHRMLSALVAARPGMAVGGCDVQQAFPSTLRDKILEKVRKHSPDTYSLVYHLYKGDSKHTVEGSPGDPLEAILQRHGLDQGCNMSMGSFCITTRDALHEAQEKLRAEATKLWKELGAEVLQERRAAQAGGGDGEPAVRPTDAAGKPNPTPGRSAWLKQMARNYPPGGR